MNKKSDILIGKGHRKSTQFVMPVNKPDFPKKASYDIYPEFEIEEQIHQGFFSLANEIKVFSKVCIDGYCGVDWEHLISNLKSSFKKLGVSCKFINIQEFYKTEKQINTFLAPFLKPDDPVFARIFSGDISMFLNDICIDEKFSEDTTILYGCGSSLGLKNAMICYVDLPKNEIQYRSRAGNVLNLGMGKRLPPKEQYRRMYFVDWPVLNKHKSHILNKINYLIDGQFYDEITWTTGNTFKKALRKISNSPFRLRPWFEPGVWGGSWIKDRIEGLNREVVNYAWSFECIVPENGIIISKNRIRLEFSFDFIMYYDRDSVLGRHAAIFGYEFPIRFDFLDTINGQNLSLQCHPTPEFIKNEFGESFTQDETYYILDASPDAVVYLGFQDDINPMEFQRSLEQSAEQGTTLDVDRFVQVHPAKKHDLFLIPHGTIHCSGKNNMVLEISSTPYIYTFKMYDWMRVDLDGKPRPLNINRAMKNLNFNCKGKQVKENYISKQITVDQGADWKLLQLITHPNHFYEVYRMEFKDKMEVENNNLCHVLSLVEGIQIEVKTSERTMIVNFAETFIIPASCNQFSLVNKSFGIAKVIRANIKPNLKKNEI